MRNTVLYWCVAGLSAALVVALLTFSAAAQRTLGNDSLSAEVSSARVALKAVGDESAVHHIRTRTNYATGYSEVRHGTGFVVGRRFITVFHNIDVLPKQGSWTREIQLGGVIVEPAIVDALNDIAVFDVPEELCPSWCNQRELASIGADLERSQRIGWYEFVSPQDARQWRQARIIEVMFKNHRGRAADTACDSDVVIAVDRPFYPGSSGGPVWDLASNRLLGMVQGSFVRESGQQVGYYKPFSCVQSLITGRIGPVTVELLSKAQAL